MTQGVSNIRMQATAGAGGYRRRAMVGQRPPRLIRVVIRSCGYVLRPLSAHGESAPRQFMMGLR
jgi:hypothetical protein